VPVACGGAVVLPGDVVVADDSGSVVVPQDAAEEVLDEVRSLLAQHKSWQEDISRGQIFGLADSWDRVVASGCAFDAPVELSGGRVRA
jgi:regulator of RNase E activity RraA